MAHSGSRDALYNGVRDVGAALSATDVKTGTLTVDDGDTIPSGGGGEGDYFNFDISGVSDSDSGAIVAGGYSDYLGTGTYTITITAAQYQSITGVGGVAALSLPADLSGSVTVTVVPEPGTYALIAGLCAFSWIATRRRK